MDNSLLKAGYIQFNPVLGNKKKNLEHMDTLIRQGREADLLVLPELCNTGYNFSSIRQAHDLAEDLNDSMFLNFLIHRASEYSLFIVAGMNELDEGKLFNTAVLVGPAGFIGKYRKIHLFWNEFDYFEKGNLNLPVFDIGTARLGMLICFDWVFPEVWRILAIKGADVICHPSNLVLPYAQQAVPVHGLINKTFNITANRYGIEGDLSFSGQSILSGTRGETILKASPSSDAVSWHEIDIKDARDKKITPRNDVMQDRFPNDYTELTNPV